VTPARRLRAAADTIDHTANAATGGPWFTDGAGIYDGPPDADIATEVAVCYATGTEPDGSADHSYADAAHVALWDPPTTRHAATLLRTIAGYVEEADRLGLSVTQGELTTCALAFADDILTDAGVDA
jgi:hypothetical protein